MSVPQAFPTIVLVIVGQGTIAHVATDVGGFDLGSCVASRRGHR